MRLAGVSFENLRGYNSAYLPLTGGITAIVGDNNQGKSSAAILLDFLLNSGDPELLQARRPLNAAETSLLIPANDSHHQARRITLHLGSPLTLGGRAISDIRLSVHKSLGEVRLNVGRPKRSETHDSVAWRALRILRTRLAFHLVPSVRDPGSRWFQDLFTDQIRSQLTRAMSHSAQGGAPRTYRDSLALRKGLKALAEQITEPIWDELKDKLPLGLSTSGRTTFDFDLAMLVQWLAGRSQVRLSTGPHDAKTVEAPQVGTGLQNVLGIALALRALEKDPRPGKMLAIEEPEVFLHLSAQRSLAHRIRDFASRHNSQVLLTTHSPVFLEEVKYGDTIVVRGRKYYPPALVPARRAQINSALMNARNAETFFASKVLLVEGPGDQELFETLIRRLQRVPSGNILKDFHVQATGSSTQFGPWIELLRCYGRSGDRPIRWLSLIDGDCMSEGLTALRTVGYRLDATIAGKVGSYSALPWADLVTRERAAEEINRIMLRIRMQFFPFDLEWAMAYDPTNEPRILSILNPILADNGRAVAASAQEAAKILGSKGMDGGTRNGALKAPHVRARYAREIPFDSLPPGLERMLFSILRRFVRNRRTREILAEAKLLNPRID